MEWKRVSLWPNSSTLSPHNPLTDGGSLPQIGYTPKIATEPAGLRELLGDRIASLGVTLRSLAQRERSARHYVEHLRTHFGPVVAAFDALDVADHERLLADMVDATQRFNRSGDATVVVPCEYLEAVAITR